MDADRTVTVETLQQLADTCERDGRPAQARLIRAVVVDIKEGAPWLHMMNKGVN